MRVKEKNHKKLMFKNLEYDNHPQVYYILVYLQKQRKLG